MPLLFTRTLRLKVRAETYPWLNAAAMEVNEVFNYCNETSFKAATRTDLKRKWMSGFDLCKLTAGATEHFDKIGADTIQSICIHYAQKRDAARRLKLRDVSSLKLARTRMAKSVLDSGWGMLKKFLDYKSQQAARMFEVVNEKSTSITCSACGALSGPRGVNGLTVRFWICCDCGESHDRDVNAARNILIGSRCRTSMSGNELSYWLIPPSNAYRVREAVTETAWAAA